MNKPILKYWETVSDTMVDNEKYPSFTLSMNEYYSISIEVKKSGNLQINTHYGGGHGEGSWTDEGRSAVDWINLIREASEVAKYYWGV